MTEVSELISGQRIASQHFPSTWTPEAQAEYEQWFYHDNHHHEPNFAVCPPCMAELEAFAAVELEQRLAVYNLAKELGLNDSPVHSGD